MAATLEVKFFVDKDTNTLLFAEAGNDFVDVLYSFLTLPLGTIVRLIGKTPSEPTSTDLGCFTTLSQSVKNLEPEYFNDEVLKDILLHPRSSTEVICRKLKVNVDDTEAKYYLCPNRHSGECNNYMSIYKNTKCPNYACDRSMSVLKVVPLEDSSKGKVFVTKASKFIVTEDLQVIPVVVGTVMGFLKDLGIKDMNALERTTVELGMNEAIELLKLTFFSTTPLKDLFVSKTKKHVNSPPKTLSHHKIDGVDRSGQDEKINVKVVLKKSNKELLFVEAGHDFVDLLFKFLVIPLGKALHLIEGESGLGCIDGLYKSVLSLDPQYFVSKDVKNDLLRPKLPPILLDLAFNKLWVFHRKQTTELSCDIDGHTRKMPVRSTVVGLHCIEEFLRSNETFIVHDNLSLTPFSVESIISICNRNKLSLSDIEEQSLSFGIEEVVMTSGLVQGISILRASLNSNKAILNGLLHNNLIFKEPKQEK